MISLLIADLLPLTLAVTLFTVFGAWLFFRTPATYWLKVILVPTAMLMWVALIATALTLLGYAYPARLPAKFTLLGFNVVVVDGKKTGIEVWADGDRTRLYVVPFSKPLEQALGAAARKGKGGGAVDMKRKEGGRGKGAGGIEANEDEYESNLRLPSDDNPKVSG